MSDYFLGIDLGGTNIKIGLFDGQGQVVARDSLLSRIDLGPESTVERVADAVRRLVSPAEWRKVHALGIGCPGPIDLEQGRIIKAGNLRAFDNFPVRARLSQKLNLPAHFDNDANAACWGEFWVGAGKDVSDMGLLTLGTGIGGGIICAGELVHGCEGNAAELGHMIIQPAGRQCTCGQQGCLEAYASATATCARAEEALDRATSSSLAQIRQETGSITAEDVFDQARKGDTLANEIIDGTARALAQACVNIRHLIEPQRVVMAGGMSKAGDILVNRIRVFYEQMIWSLKPEPMDICLAKLGDDAGVIGAAGLAQHAARHGRLSPAGS